MSPAVYQLRNERDYVMILIFFRWPLKLNQFFEQICFDFSGYFLRRKIIIKILLSSMRTLANSEDFPKAASRFLFWLPVLQLVYFLQCLPLVRHRKNQRKWTFCWRLSEQFSGSQAVFGTKV
jgi:hypothetical protein